MVNLSSDPAQFVQLNKSPHWRKDVPYNNAMLFGWHFFNDLPIDKLKQTISLFGLLDMLYKLVSRHVLFVKNHITPR
jgi:hypothetical protein